MSFGVELPYCGTAGFPLHICNEDCQNTPDGVTGNICSSMIRDCRGAPAGCNTGYVQDDAGHAEPISEQYFWEIRRKTGHGVGMNFVMREKTIGPRKNRERRRVVASTKITTIYSQKHQNTSFC